MTATSQNRKRDTILRVVVITIAASFVYAMYSGIRNRCSEGR